MKTISKALLGAALVAIFAGTLSAQTADEVIEKHLTAIGGRAALGKIKSRQMTGTITLSLPVGGDVTGSIEVFNQAPNKSRNLIKVDLSSFGVGQITQEQRFDGTVGYAMDTLQGNREITGGQLDALKNAAFPSPLLNYKESGLTVTVAGKGKVGTRDAFELVLTPKTGPVARVFVDAETYLPVKNIIKVNVPQLGGDLEQTQEFSDFRDVDGLKIPFQIKTVSQVQTFTINLTKVQNNVELDSAMFSKP